MVGEAHRRDRQLGYQPAVDVVISCQDQVQDVYVSTKSLFLNTKWTWQDYFGGGICITLMVTRTKYDLTSYVRS